jgi:hypothetical protein
MVSCVNPAGENLLSHPFTERTRRAKTVCRTFLQNEPDGRKRRRKRLSHLLQNEPDGAKTACRTLLQNEPDRRKRLSHLYKTNPTGETACRTFYKTNPTAEIVFGRQLNIFIAFFLSG